MPTEAQKRANAKYQKSNVKTITLKFSPVEADLYGHARSHGNASGYVKGLIRADMERGRDK